MISPRKQIVVAEQQIAVSYTVAENFLLINITVCGNNWRAPSHSAQTLERRSNQSAHESRSAESQFHTYEISRVLRDEGGMIQHNPVSTIGEKGLERDQQHDSSSQYVNHIWTESWSRTINRTIYLQAACENCKFILICEDKVV